jgi:hypothetical protein
MNITKNKNQLFLTINMIVFFMIVVAAAQAQPPQPPTRIPRGLLTRLIEIKYTAELFATNALKKEGNKINEKDSAMAIYNTVRLKVDGLVYQISGDMIAANSPRKIRLLDKWCMQQRDALSGTKPNTKNVKRTIQNYVLALKEIDDLFREQAFNISVTNKTLNLTTNVFYLLKDSYTIIQGLSDMKTKKTMALIELLDHTRLMSIGELSKGVK